MYRCSGVRRLQPGRARTQVLVGTATYAQPDGRDGEEDSGTTQTAQVSGQIISAITLVRY